MIGKKWVALFLVLACMICMTACGGQTEGGSVDTQSDPVGGSVDGSTTYAETGSTMADAGTTMDVSGEGTTTGTAGVGAGGGSTAMTTQSGTPGSGTSGQASGQTSGQYQGHSTTATAPTSGAASLAPGTTVKTTKSTSGSQTPGHTHAWSYSVTVAATCLRQGYTSVRCGCGHTEEQNVQAALGHSWSDWSVTREPTATATGEKARTCSRCGERETKTLDKVGVTVAPELLRVLELVNEERAAAGLQPMTYYYAEQEAADLRAKECVDAGAISHTRPNGEQFYTALEGLGKDYFGCGENLASGFSTPEKAMKAWMDSKGHRANILNANFTALVVGHEGDVWVQLFLSV